MDMRRLVLDCFRDVDECLEKELGRRLGTVKAYVNVLTELLEEGYLVKVDQGYRVTTKGRRWLEANP